jgi:hypothetical protein
MGLRAVSVEIRVSLIYSGDEVPDVLRDGIGSAKKALQLIVESVMQVVEFPAALKVVST